MTGKEIFGIILVYALLWCINVLVQSVLLDKKSKFFIRINLPKRKRFLKKVDPIYRVIEKGLTPYMYVQKWSLMWVFPELVLCLIALVCPIPLRVYIWKYGLEGEFPICRSEKFNPSDYRSAKDLYESLEYAATIKKEAELTKEQKKQIEIDALNKIFDENYED
jgi:hypothetical protein